MCKEKGYKLPILNISIRKLQNEEPKNKIKNNTSNVTKINKKTRENYGKNIEDSIKIFHTITKEGPIYVCSICQQINFLHNLSQITKLKKKNKLLEECNIHYKAIINIEYICNTSKKYIYKNKVPKLSIKNGCGFNEKPEILDLFCLEERFISPVMAFMLIHQLFPGGQFPHFFPTKKQVHLHNKQIINISHFTIESKALDVVHETISKILQNNIHIAISKRQEHQNSGLPQLIVLNTEQQYDIISNINVNDGIINDAECCIKYIETKQDENKKVIPTIIWVQFENEKIGKDHRQKNSYLYHNKQINHKWTPITKIHRSFLVKNIWIHRIQFQLRQAAARTIHVSQSSTYNKIYVD